MISRMEVVPPAQPGPGTEDLSSPIRRPSAATATASPSFSPPRLDAETPTKDEVSWAVLPNGPVLYDASLLSSSSVVAPAGEACRDGNPKAKRPSTAVVALAGTADSYTCCFMARGDAEHRSPLGKLRVTWKPEQAEKQPEEEEVGRSGRGNGGGRIGSSVEAFGRGGGVAVGAGAVAVTEFPLPVLSARPPALSARLKAPPYARVGEEFSIRSENVGRV